MKDKKNVLLGPFRPQGLSDVVIGICNEYKHLINRKDGGENMRGSAVDHYQSKIIGSNISTWDQYYINFPVAKGLGFNINIILQGQKPRHYKSEKQYTYKVTLIYSRDDFKPTRYKRISSKEIYSTKKSFNLNLVFKHIEEAKEYLIKREQKNLGNDAIRDLEKIAWDGMFNDDNKTSKHSSGLTIETKRENVLHTRYNSAEPTGNGDDILISNIEEHKDENGKRFFNLKQLKLDLKPERNWSDKSFYRFDNSEELKKVLDEARTAIKKLSTMLKETAYVGETESSRSTS